MSKIYINNVIASGKHGANPGEKDMPQQFRVSISLDFDMSKAAITDDLVDTLDWSVLRGSVIDAIEHTSFNLVERLAAEVANRLMADRRVTRASIKIDKLEAFTNGLPGVLLEQTRN